MKIQHNQRGFTLIETVITMLVATLVLTSIVTGMIYMSRSFVAVENYSDMNRQSRLALDLMSKRVRQAKALTVFSPTNLVFLDYDNTNTFSYTFDSNNRTLTMSQNGVNAVLLDNCDSLVFNMAQRNPSNNYTFYPTTNVATAKIIYVTWKTSRNLLVSKLDTENIQTAKIVIRN